MGILNPVYDDAGNYVPRTVLICDPKESRTKQAHKAECDVNLIVKKFEKTGLVTHLAKGVPRYADVSQMTDYREAIETVRAAEEFFSGLPASVRAEFNNDPAELLDAMHDPERHARLIELGLLEAREGPSAPSPAPAPPAAPAEPPVAPAAPPTPPA